MPSRSAALRFRHALSAESPLQIIGTINAYCALLAKSAGYKAIYLSGAGVANASMGLPDIGITNLNDVLTDALRITAATELPLLVDVDTGFGSAFGVARCVKEMIRAGVAAIHIEDQVATKRCGHRPNKELVSAAEMVDRLKAAVDARFDQQFMIIARTDALASEGLAATLERAQHYVEAGADAIFAEAVTRLDDYQQFKKTLNVPILANITEFGKTPLYSLEQLKHVGVDMILYPLTAFRAMSAAAYKIYHEVRIFKTQQGLIDHMQTREQLYEILNYYHYEEQLDKLYGEDA